VVPFFTIVVEILVASDEATVGFNNFSLYYKIYESDNKYNTNVHATVQDVFNIYKATDFDMKFYKIICLHFRQLIN
jgi:hypothetical protein